MLGAAVGGEKEGEWTSVCKILCLRFFISLKFVKSLNHPSLYTIKTCILRLKPLLSTKESVLFACAPSSWKTTSSVSKSMDRVMNGTVGQRKIVRFEYQVSHIQCNIEPEKPRSYYIQARPNTWLFINCGAGAEQLPNMKRVKMAGGWDFLITLH